MRPPDFLSPALQTSTTRLRCLITGAAGVGVALASSVSVGNAAAPPPPPGAWPDGLFSLGVSSGDPLPDSVVLWTFPPRCAGWSRHAGTTTASGWARRSVPSAGPVRRPRLALPPRLRHLPAGPHDVTR
jgi:hypothetical protein